MIQACMTCNDVKTHTIPKMVDGKPENEKFAEEVTLHPVYSDDKNSPNYSFSEATPSGELRLFISNKEAFGKIVRGKTYDINITETTT